MNPKVALLLAVAIIAASLGVLDYATHGGLGNPAGWLTGLFQGGYKTITFQTNLSFATTPSLKFDFSSPVTFVGISYTSSNNTIYVNSLARKSDSLTALTLDSYEGSLSVTNVLGFEGTSKNVVINTDTWSLGNKKIPVSGKNLVFDNTKLNGVPKISLSLNNMTGVLVWAGKGVYNLNDESIDIKSFEGNIEIRGLQIFLDGTAQIKTQALLTPSD